MVKGEKRVWSGHSWSHFSRGESGGNRHLKWPQEFQTDYHEAKTPENWFKLIRNAACMVKKLQCNNIKKYIAAPLEAFDANVCNLEINRFLFTAVFFYIKGRSVSGCRFLFFFIRFTLRSFSITRTFLQVEVKVAASPRLLRLEPQIKVCEMFAERSCCWEQDSGRTWWW